LSYNSFYDNKGKLYVDCSECNRGGNGDVVDKCSCGSEIKKSKGLGCFLGDLLKTIDETSLRKLL
jgi:hypothetical protein